MRYRLVFGKDSQIILALVLPGFVGIIPLYIALTFFPGFIPKETWALFLYIALYVAFVIFFTLKLVDSIRTEVEVTVGTEKMNIAFIKKSIFQSDHIDLPYELLSNTSEDNDRGFDFFYLETNISGAKRFHLMAKEGDSDFSEFKSSLSEAIHNFSVEHSQYLPIKHISIYQKWPMICSALFLFLSCIILPYFFYINGANAFQTFKYWFFVTVSAPIIFKVIMMNFRRRLF